MAEDKLITRDDLLEAIRAIEVRYQALGDKTHGRYVELLLDELKTKGFDVDNPRNIERLDNFVLSQEFLDITTLDELVISDDMGRLQGTFLDDISNLDDNLQIINKFTIDQRNRLEPLADGDANTKKFLDEGDYILSLDEKIPDTPTNVVDDVSEEIIFTLKGSAYEYYPSASSEEVAINRVAEYREVDPDLIQKEFDNIKTTRKKVGKGFQVNFHITSKNELELVREFVGSTLEYAESQNMFDEDNASKSMEKYLTDKADELAGIREIYELGPRNVVDSQIIQNLETNLKNKYPELETFILEFNEKKGENLPYIQKDFVAGRDYIYLNSIDVFEDARGQGVGDTVMKELVAWADTNDIPILLDTRAGDIGLTKFYEKYGFLNTGNIITSRQYTPTGSFRLVTAELIRQPGSLAGKATTIGKEGTHKSYQEAYGKTRFTSQTLPFYTQEQIYDLLINDAPSIAGIEEKDIVKWAQRTQPDKKLADEIYELLKERKSKNITDTPGGSLSGGSLGAAKLNDPFVFDSWVDNYANTTTSFVDNLPLVKPVKDMFLNAADNRLTRLARQAATPGGILDAVDIWEIGVLALVAGAIAFNEIDEIPKITKNAILRTYNLSQGRPIDAPLRVIGLPVLSVSEYDIDFEYAMETLERGEKVMPTDIIIEKLKPYSLEEGEDVILPGTGVTATTGAKQQFEPYGEELAKRAEKTVNMKRDEVKQKILESKGVQEEKMFEQAKPKKSKATGGAGAKIL